MPSEIVVMLIGALCVALVFVPPFLLFRPLVLAIADRVRGKHAGGNASEIQSLKQRLAIVEQELHDYRTRIIACEETAEFTKHLLEKKENPGE